jgi:hypothetical protein
MEQNQIKMYKERIIKEVSDLQLIVKTLRLAGALGELNFDELYMRLKNINASIGHINECDADIIMQFKQGLTNIGKDGGAIIYEINGVSYKLKAEKL